MKTIFVLALFISSVAHASFQYSLEPVSPGCVEITDVHVDWPFPAVGLDDVVTQIRFYFSQTEVTEASHFIAVNVTPDGKSFSPTQFCQIPSGHWSVKYGFVNQYVKLVEFAREATAVDVP